MSSWKKAAKAGQKTHRERHQPESREYLGILEKKKDYVVRAKDFNKKKSILKLLHKRVLNKNPDEFYFHMINSKVENGHHMEKKKSQEFTDEQIKLMKTQDLKYVAYKRNIEAKRVDKLQSQLHLIDTVNETPNKHVFFVDDEEEQNFDLAKKLDTHPALINRRSNRPKLSDLSRMKLPNVGEETLMKIDQQKHMAYKELSKRIDRERELTLVQQKIEMERALKDQTLVKPKLIRKGSKTAAPIYKWNYQRKR